MKAYKYIQKASKQILEEAIHKHSYFEAMQILRNLTKVNGKCSNSVFRKCDEYARDIYGSTKYSHWLKVYAAVSGDFKEGWIPDNYYALILIPIIKNEYGTISKTRTLESKIFGYEYFPDVAHYANGFFTTPNYETISPNSVKEYIFSKHKKVVYKLSASARGKGTTIYTKENFDVNTVASLGNGVFQSYIEQHPFFDNFSANSVVTIRMTSAINNDGIATCRAALLRIPKREDSVVLWEKTRWLQSI